MTLIFRPLRSSFYFFRSIRRYSSHRWTPSWSHHHLGHGSVADDDISNLANKPLHALSLADLVKHGRPPLSKDALLSSANFTLSLLPIRLAHRIQALRNLPYIVVSNPNISKIYNNYLHSLSTLLPYNEKHISTVQNEVQFTEVLADLVQTHSNTIPTLAKGFLECRKYISPAEVTRFLDEHLRARIGTRLIAEQHIALHYACPEDQQSSYIGVIDTALQPASIINSCGAFVCEICELKYGVRPSWVIDGEPTTTFAYVPVHLEYIITELLKNAFRATVESGKATEPIVITIVAEPEPEKVDIVQSSSSILPLSDTVPGVTIRIRDRGGGISPEVLPNIWSYSFTTFLQDDDVPGSSPPSNPGMSALDTIAGAGISSSIAGLGYGLPLSRAYAEYFGGSIAIQSLYGWGCDVYLHLKGVGNIDKNTR